MIVDLVQVVTRDGVRLDGTLQVPASQCNRVLPVDAFIFVHGTGGSFYSSTLFDSFAGRLLVLGSAVLRINTRGHDLMSTALTGQGGRRLGAAYEVVDECRHDLAAWIDWLATARRGYSRIGLVGHSLGAVKCIYTLAQEPHSAITSLVAISPPRLSYTHFCASPQAAEFQQIFTAAAEHVQAGRSQALMDVKLPLPFVVTAGGYIEKYGPDERYNFLKLVGRVPCPTLITFGSNELEPHMAFRGLPEALAPIAATHRRMQVEIIAAADHFYTGARAELLARVESWLLR